MTASSGVLDSDSIALGPQPSEVAAVAILVHGRSHSPNEMCDLAVGLANPSICFVIPAARGGTWYPDIVLCGFSQGACLTVEFLIRNPRPYGAVLIFTGGFIGPPRTQWPVQSGAEASTSLPHRQRRRRVGGPPERVEETGRLLRASGARVKQTIFDDSAHEVCEEEMAAARELLAWWALRDAGNGNRRANN
jgi:phospholipase/carboxylesterase